MKKISSLLITVTDGWAYRFLFCTGAFEYLSSNYRIKLFVSKFYFEKLKEYKCDQVELYDIEVKSSELVGRIISLKNYIYRNYNRFNISKFYIAKLSVGQRVLFYVFKTVVLLFGDKLLICLDFILRIILKRRKGDFDDKLVGVENAIFLSPYAIKEVKFIKVVNDYKFKKYFILPSWDNIYKYHLNDDFNKYIVWGPDQKEFFKRIGISSNKILCLGSLTQYVFNRLKCLDYCNFSSDGFRIMYSTVTDKIFPGEFYFVRQIADLVNNEFYGSNVNLLIRLHPADVSNEYKSLVSKRVSVSGHSLGNDISEWKVSNNFFELQVMDILSSDLVITVASTITLDSILLGKATVNYRPSFCIGDKDYYNFEHYTSITKSNGLKIVNNINEMNKVISDSIRGLYVFDDKMEKAIIGATVKHKLYQVESYFKEFLNEV